jgi:hypothetical protein
MRNDYRLLNVKQNQENEKRKIYILADNSDFITGGVMNITINSYYINSIKRIERLKKILSIG